MGFRTGNWATVWSVEPQSDVATKVRLSISRKDKQTNEYNEDFSGFVMFYGSATAARAARLKERDRIRLGDVDVRSRYVPDKKTTYYNFNVYSFDTAAEAEGGKPQALDDSFMQIPDNATDDLLPF